MTTESNLSESLVVNHAIRIAVNTSNLDDVKELIGDKKCYRVTGNTCETISKFMIGASGVLSFASVSFDNPLLTFFAGVTSVVSLTLLHFAAYAAGESKERTEQLNILLDRYHIEHVPLIIAEPDAKTTWQVGHSSSYIPPQEIQIVAEESKDSNETNEPNEPNEPNESQEAQGLYKIKLRSMNMEN